MIPGVIESRTCLLPMVTRQSWDLVNLYHHYQNRILPFGGGLYEQPHFYAEAMLILDVAFRKLKEEIAEKAIKDAKTN